MPEKFDRCVKSVMESGKSEESAYAICTAQFKDEIIGHFRDSAIFDPKEKTAISVRDGVLEYLGYELGMMPADKIFKVYRSPATIANVAMKMIDIPITDDHVSLDMPAPTGGGSITAAEMIDVADPTCNATIAIKNKLALGDTLRMMVEAGKRELSLGYNAKLIPHDEYDFEQVNIVPHHLAGVERGRCGSMCSFIDRKPSTTGKETEMKQAKQAKPLHRVFTDEDGAMNLQQVVEMAMALPEAIKSVPVDQLAALVEPLKAIIEAAKAAGVAPEVAEPAAPAEPAEPATDAMPEEDKPKFSDKAVVKMTRDFADKAIKEYAGVVEKARGFMPEDYKFADKTTDQIRRDAVATQTAEKFSDAELVLAFKLLKPAGKDYSNFGDAAQGDFATVSNKEM